ncbi:MAG TPA: DUF1553 domain-containing protein [Planctomycetaceae bacterium]|nr:DUF1553 domain-containing protein [Planctomycetaceae bacterium]
MPLRLLIAACVWLTAALEASAGPPPLPAEREVDFERDVRPILEQRCWDCHGPDTQESRLRLDRREALLRGGDSGQPAIVAGKSVESRLIRLVAGQDPDRVMPPDGKRLTGAQIGLLRAWIDQGAKWPETGESDAGAEGAVRNAEFWSFRPVRRVVPPAPPCNGARERWPAGPLDAFILHKLREADLEASPAADRVSLVRRLSLDVLGLPPSPEEIDEFVADRAPDAWPKVVDRALASPHFGERWAQHWLDVVRFAETDGFEMNQERSEAWHYRDYVMAAFNADVRYDQFVFEQLAGDAAGAEPATGFLVAGAYDKVKSPDAALTLMQRQDELADMINTAGTAFLGLTIGCARCHNHKFDPVLQKDYYALQAVFAGVEHGTRPIGRRDGAQRQRELAQVADELARVNRALAESGVRPPVSPTQNEERFAPTAARSLRFTIRATNNGIEPCLDELEVFAAGGESNVALASAGARTAASGTYPGSEIHKLEHLNDGRYGNERSWISNEHGRGWVTVDFGEPVVIDRIVWGRDRNGRYADRVPTDYTIEVSPNGADWQVVATSDERLPARAGTGLPGDVLPNRSEQKRQEIESLLAEFRSIASQRDALAQQSADVLAYAGTFKQPGPVHRLYRGDPLAPREVVEPDALTVLGTLGLSGDAPERERRVALARWLVSPDNPLTARVIVNRLWQHHFGRGLVETPSDFGRNGARPTHPELLDWLAMELVKGQETRDKGPENLTLNSQPSTLNSPWSLKRIHRLILLSSTYRQSSAPTPAGLERDAQTRLLWRFPPRRLAAEVIRDSLLAVSGVLDRRMGGPGYSVFEPNDNYVRVYNPKPQLGPAEWRRMVYMTKVRMEHDPVFGPFDCPDAGQPAPQRPRSTTALQALGLLNSRFTLDQAEVLAGQLRRESGDDAAAQVVHAFRLALGRPPDAAELHAAEELIAGHGVPAFCRALFNANEFLFLP